MSTEARALLASLPDLLSVPQTRPLRLTARFDDGRLLPPLELAQFRIPAASVGTIVRPTLYRADVDTTLEEIAGLLGIITNAAQLVAEYQPNTQTPRLDLRWVDAIWQMRPTR